MLARQTECWGCRSGTARAHRGVAQAAAVQAQALAQQPWGSLRAQRLPLRRGWSFCVGACVGAWWARLRVQLLAFRRQALPQQWLFRASARSRLRAQARRSCVGACVGVWWARLRVQLQAFRRQALPQQWLFRASARSRLRARQLQAQARRFCVGACAWRAALPLRGTLQRRPFRVRWAALLSRQPLLVGVGACVWARLQSPPLARSARSPPSLRRLRAQARQFCVGACARRALTRVQSASPPVPAPTRSARSA